MSDLVASGTVTVRSLYTGQEWDEIVEVFEQDMAWAREHGHETSIEDQARKQAQRQAEPDEVETLECDIS